MNENHGARSRSDGSDPGSAGASSDVNWTALTWNDLERWAGSRSVTRGRDYQRDGRVKNLTISSDGELLATVVGGERYTTTVSLAPGRISPSLHSICTCPVGADGCKHAVAVVAEYLQALADGRDVPAADDDDPRWDELDGEFVEIWDEDEEDSWEDAEPIRRPRAPRKSSRKRAGAVDWDDKIEGHIRAKSRDELADLVCSLAQRFPEIREEFRERIALQEGNVERLVAETRRKIRRVTSEDAWRDPWSGGGHIPDYGQIRHRFERLLELGHADEVVSLGREFIAEGLRQVGEADDEEGETAEAFAKCLPVVFQAVTRSSLSGSERLLFAIDACLADARDAIGDACDAVLDAPTPPEDWSAAADALIRRLETSPAPKGRGIGEDFSRDYERDQLTGWIGEALEKAGRAEELRALYESEARITTSYERLVAFLLEQEDFEAAERWASEGIASTREKLPGIASALAERLRKLAEKRERWDVVAAHAAHQFFSDDPSRSTFNALMEAARKAGVEEPTRAAALRFLETGVMPYKVVSETPPAATAKGKGGPSPAKKRGRAPRSKTKTKGETEPAAATTESTPPAPDRLEIAPEWPLPVPDHLVPLLKGPGRRGLPTSHPRLDVLLDMALAANRPDEALRWFDRMRSAPSRSNYSLSAYGSSYGDRVAEAVAATHPKRAIEIYKAALNARLPHADQSAYESATAYLRKLRPLYKALDQESEWTALVASIREKYRGRPRFMERLDGLEDRPIVQSEREEPK